MSLETFVAESNKIAVDALLETINALKESNAEANKEAERQRTIRLAYETFLEGPGMSAESKLNWYEHVRPKLEIFQKRVETK